VGVQGAIFSKKSPLEIVKVFKRDSTSWMGRYWTHRNYSWREEFLIMGGNLRVRSVLPIHEAEKIRTSSIRRMPPPVRFIVLKR
jgi:hypothetical protein